MKDSENKKKVLKNNERFIKKDKYLKKVFNNSESFEYFRRRFENLNAKKCHVLPLQMTWKVLKHFGNILRVHRRKNH